MPDQSNHLSTYRISTTEEFEKLLIYLGTENILSPKEWQEKALAKELSEKDICLSFDDALKCQYDIAFPILKKHGLKAFWFVYSGVLEGQTEWLEIYRYFRTEYFENVNEYYNNFFDIVAADYFDLELLKP